MPRLAGTNLLRLTLARACAWALLVAGWVGIGGRFESLHDARMMRDCGGVCKSPCTGTRIAPKVTEITPSAPSSGPKVPMEPSGSFTAHAPSAWTSRDSCIMAAFADSSSR